MTSTLAIFRFNFTTTTQRCLIGLIWTNWLHGGVKLPGTSILR